MKKLIIITCLVLASSYVVSAKPPMKFGKVPMEDLTMTVYDKDTSAPAVILCDYGYFATNEFQFTRMIRIKILKKEGLSYADFNFQGSEKSSVKGITFNMENGQVTKDKLKNDQIFRERITNDFYRLRCSMPNVKVGSVIDIEYYYNDFPIEWDFQRYIPVKWSELIIESSPYIDFRKNFYGYQPLAISSDTRWVAEDMPAFKKEAYVNSSDNYLTKIEFDILSIHVPGFYREYTTTWDAANQRLDNDPYFGQAARGNLYLNSVAKEIKSKYTNDLDKAKAAYNEIKKIKWDETESAETSTQSLITVFNKKIGNSADINIMLTELFKKIGLDAYNVVMSTRSNGIMSPFFPSLNKLNYVISQVKIGDKTYLVDATEELLPFGLLPFRCLNGLGRAVSPDKNFAVNITAPGKDKTIALYTVDLKDDNTLEGKCQVVNSEYAAFDFRKDYQKANSEDEFIENLENENAGLHIHDFNLEDLDSIEKPIKEIYNFEISNQINSIGNELYINPLLTNQITDNPFKLDTRQFPVDYGYPIENTYIYSYTIPDNYQIEEIPKPISLGLASKGASFLYNVSKSGNRIVISCKFIISKETFLPGEYFELKELYNQIIKKEAEPIVLKKI